METLYNVESPTKLTSAYLKQLAKDLGYRNVSHMSRGELCDLLDKPKQQQWQEAQLALQQCTSKIRDLQDLQEKDYPESAEIAATIASLRNWHQNLLKQSQDMREHPTRLTAMTVRQLTEEASVKCPELIDAIRDKLLHHTS